MNKNISGQMNGMLWNMAKIMILINRFFEQFKELILNLPCQTLPTAQTKKSFEIMA